MQNSEINQHNLLGKISLFEILSFFKEGLQLALSKDCRLFVIIPICINFIVLLTGAYFAHQAIASFLDTYIAKLPDFLSFLSTILSIIIWISLGFVFCFVFSTVATIIASPFYGLLAEKVELKIYGTKGNDDGIIDILKDIPRILKRELQKQIFFIPRALLCLIIFFIPIINVIFPVLWALLSFYMATIQYSDYAFDNHKVKFSLMKQALGTSKLTTFAFGGIIAIALTIPILNLLIPPCAVCAGTQYYVRLRQVNPDLPLQRKF